MKVHLQGDLRSRWISVDTYLNGCVSPSSDEENGQMMDPTTDATGQHVNEAHYCCRGPNDLAL